MRHFRTALIPMTVLTALVCGTGCHRGSNDVSNEQTTSRPGATASPIVSANSPDTANSVNAQHDGIIPESNDHAVTASGQHWSTGEFAGQGQENAGLGTNDGMPATSQDSGTTMSGTTSPSDQTEDSVSGTSSSGTLTNTPGSTSNDGTNARIGPKNTRKKTSTGQRARDPQSNGTSAAPAPPGPAGETPAPAAPVGPGNPLKH